MMVKVRYGPLRLKQSLTLTLTLTITLTITLTLTLEEIPKLLEKYKGNEAELIRKLEKKYGVSSPVGQG
jgi:hypothetical protein